jgi:hypothetical protein
MRSFNNLARDRTQNRCPVSLIARCPPGRQIGPSGKVKAAAGLFADFTRQRGAVTDGIEFSGVKLKNEY